MTKRKIAIFSSVGVGVGIASYFAFTTVPAMAAAVPAFLTFAACPAMCAAMGGAMLLQKRHANKKNLSKMAVKEMMFSESEVLDKKEVINSPVIPRNEQLHQQNKQAADLNN